MMENQFVLGKAAGGRDTNGGEEGSGQHTKPLHGINLPITADWDEIGIQERKNERGWRYKTKQRWLRM